MAQPLPITFANLPVGLEPLALFDQQFAASVDGAYFKDNSIPLSALLTGASGLAIGVATFLGNPTSANLAAAVTDETGTGPLVFADSPVLVAPALGTPTALVLTNATGLDTVGSGAGRLPSANGGSLTFDTVADAAAFAPASAPDYLRTAGYAAAGDGGGALYKRVNAEPAHAGKFSVTEAVVGTTVWYELAEFMPDIRMFGCKLDPGDQSTDSSAALQDAIISGFPLTVPPGTFIFSVGTVISTEWGAIHCAATLRPGLHIYGVRGQSIFKIKDNCSTDAAPINFDLFAGNNIYDDLHIEGVIFDLNGQNNKISPNRSRTATVTIYNAAPGQIAWPAHGLAVGDEVRFASSVGNLPAPLEANTTYYVQSLLSADAITIAATSGGDALTIDAPVGDTGIETGTYLGAYNGYNCAGILVGGTVQTVGVDARITNSKIIACEVINSPGVSCIVTAGRYGEGFGVLSDNIEIAHCRFYNNGLDAEDHSSVYAYGTNIKVHHNFFDHPTQSQGIEGPVVACELHGSGNSFTDNTVRNYVQGLWITGGDGYAVLGVRVARNNINVLWLGIGTWTVSPENWGLTDVQIRGNHIVIAPDAITSWRITSPKCAAKLVSNAGFVQRVDFAGNLCETTDTTGNYGVLVTADSAANTSVSNAIVKANIIDGFSIGVLVGSSGGPTYGTVVNDNVITSCRKSATAPDYPIGIQVLGTHGKLTLRGNSVGLGSEDPYTGISLSGSATDLDMDGNSFTNGVTQPIAGSMSVPGRRTGKQATTFSGVPTDGTWKPGDLAYCNDNAVQGTGDGKYLVWGWRRATSGTGNVLGTDWFELRTTISLPSYGEIGSYVFASNISGTPGPGDIVDGSTLKPTSNGGTAATTLTGTWQCCGFTNATGQDTLYRRTA